MNINWKIFGYVIVQLLLISLSNNAFSPTSSFQRSRPQKGAMPQLTSAVPQVGWQPNKMIQSVSTKTSTTFSSSYSNLFAASSTSIVDEVMDEMKKAMKAKDTVTLNTIRLIRSSFANAAIDLKTDKLSDEDAKNVLKKLAKMRKESIEMYEKGGALDRAEAERIELNIIEKWLPSLANEETVRSWVQEAIAEAGPGNMGKVMGALMKKHKAEIDGGMAQKIVKEELAKL